ncbi:hypothetical protein [Gemmatimonas sp.]|jgi:hypothetical protein|uniref:hypothetical protein n=1 Tax=Gemmatimonas sp. TaxID=1962908 RepID=UPI0037BE583C
MPRSTRLIATVALAAAAVTSSGCFLVAAGAGAGAAVAYTNRGATATIEGTVPVVFDKAVRAFGTLQIAETGRATENSGDLQRLVGTFGEQEITVEVKRSSENVAAVEVTAKKNVVDYDKDLAKRVLDAMMK